MTAIVLMRSAHGGSALDIKICMMNSPTKTQTQITSDTGTQTHPQTDTDRYIHRKTQSDTNADRHRIK